MSIAINHDNFYAAAVAPVKMGNAMLLFRPCVILIFLSLSSDVAASFGILQSFPKNTTYCCHCPSLSLKCEFPPGVSLVLWSIPDKRITNIPAMYPDHKIDNSKMSEGFSELTVADVSSLEARYGCIVIFPNGSSIAYDDKSNPPQQDWTMLNVTFTTSDFISYLIKWDDPYPYPECFNLSITVDDNLVFASNNGILMSYNMKFSDPISLHYVCVNATDQSVQSVVKCTTIISGFKLNLNVSHLDNGLHHISWSNPFPGVFTFEVFLNNRLVFETETEASYTTNRNNEDVCVVAQDKHGNNWRECDSREESFEVAWANSGTFSPVIFILTPSVFLVLMP